MSKKKSRSRPGEITSATKQLILDLAKHEASVAGFADGCLMVERKDVVEVVFFETRSAASAISVARLFITYLDVVQVWAHTASLHDSLEAMTDRGSWGEYTILSAPPRELQSVSTPAPLCTVIAMAKTGAAALLEFYYVTATSTFRATQGKGQLKIVPLFGVQVPAGLIWAFVQRIKTIASSHSIETTSV